MELDDARVADAPLASALQHLGGERARRDWPPGTTWFWPVNCPPENSRAGRTRLWHSNRHDRQIVKTT
jgi:hypothetical protein